MLVLSRKVGEHLVIGDNVVIHVVGTHNGRVRLAIQAPQDVAVWRGELAGRMPPTSASAEAPRKPR